MSDKKLAGKAAIVTGASKGIGAAIARRLGADGAAVAVNYASSRSGADQVVSDITAAGGKAVAVQGNVASAGDTERIVAETLKAFGRLDILVNNAGVYEEVKLGDLTEAHYRRIFDVNVLGLMLMTQSAVKKMGPEGGSVINIGSLATVVTPPGYSVYSATKAALDTITLTFAKELGARKIRVNSIKPGMVETEGFRAAGLSDSDLKRNMEKLTPLGRIGQPDDIADVVAFYASEDSRWITGESVVVSGGLR